jgi:acylphosphatase
MELSSNRRVRITVRGRVQGVGYRASTVYEASRLRLTGWVRNQPDGSVLLEAQGPSDKVAQLEAWCRRGPSLAKVTTCDVEEVSVVSGEDDFDVRR